MLKATILRRLFLLLATSLFVLPYSHELRAETLLLSVPMVEASAYPRTGTLDVYVPDTANPYATDPFAGPYVVDWWARLNWESICGGNVFLGGGHAEGWVFNISTMDPSFTLYSDSVYAVTFGSFLSADDGSFAERYPCNSGRVPLEYGVAIVVVYKAEDRFDYPGYGTIIGEVAYSTDYSPAGQLYFLYVP